MPKKGKGKQPSGAGAAAEKTPKRPTAPEPLPQVWLPNQVGGRGSMLTYPTLLSTLTWTRVTSAYSHTHIHDHTCTHTHTQPDPSIFDDSSAPEEATGLPPSQHEQDQVALFWAMEEANNQRGWDEEKEIDYTELSRKQEDRVTKEGQLFVWSVIVAVCMVSHCCCLYNMPIAATIIVLSNLSILDVYFGCPITIQHFSSSASYRGQPRTLQVCPVLCVPSEVPWMSLQPSEPQRK